jgi:hypothetical protein
MFIIFGLTSHRHDSSGEVIYCGGDGDEAEKALAKVPAGKFVRAGKLLNPSFIPVPIPANIAAEEHEATKPVETQPETVVEKPISKLTKK